MIDGCDLLEHDPLVATPDGAWVLGFVLFADIDWTDGNAVEARRLEWVALFGDRHA